MTLKGDTTMFNSVNPRPVKRYKWKIYKDFTLVDLGFIFIVGGSLSIIMLALIENMVIKLAVGLMPFVFSPLFTISVPSQQCKVYHLIGRYIAFLFRKKHYDKSKSSWLIPYDKIDEDGLVKVLGNKGEYIRIIKVSGFNFLTLTDEESHQYIDSYRTFIKSLKFRFSIIATDMPISVEAHKEYLNSLKVSNKDVLKIANDMLEVVENGETNTEKNYYFCFLGSKKALQNEERFIIDGLVSMDLVPKVIDESEIINVLGKFYGNDEVSSLKELINPFSPVTFKQSSFIMNGKHMAIYAINEFPFDSSEGWMFPLTQIKDVTFVTHVESYDLAKAKKKIDKIISDLRGRNQATHRHSESAVTEHEYNLLSELSNQIQQQSEVVNSSYTFLIAASDSAEGLREIHKDIRAKAIAHDFKINTLTYLQFDAFDAVLPKKSGFLKRLTSTEVPASSQANGFPFFQDYLDDEKGIYLGYSQMGSNIFFDPWIINPLRKNHNGSILGASGGGKSTLLKKLAKDNWMRDAKVIIIDPQRENKKLCETLGGKWLNMGADSQSKKSYQINPLQFFQESEDQGSIASHIQFLEGFFKTLYQDLNQVQVGELRDILLNLYRHKLKSKTSYEPKDFPILRELSDAIDKEFERVKKSTKEDYKISNLYALSTLFRVFQSDDAPESKMWNGHTNFDTRDEKFIVFDIQTLNSSQNTRLINAQMHILLKFTFSEIIRNKVINIAQKKEEKVLVIVDEAHLLINEKHPAGLQFLYEMSKTVRKFSGSLFIATQNIADLLGRSDNVRALTSAIINNTQYSFYFQLNPDDFKSLEVANSSSSHKFSEEERAFIVGARKGDCLLALTPSDRKMIHVDVSDKEIAIWKEKHEA